MNRGKNVAIEAFCCARKHRHDMASLMPSANKQSLTELIRSIRKVSAKFGSFRLEKEWYQDDL